MTGARNASSAFRSNSTTGDASRDRRDDQIGRAATPPGRAAIAFEQPPRRSAASGAHSARKYHRSATRVPTCSATSKERPGSCQPRTHGASTRCAELLTAMNSASPCSSPRTRAWNGVMDVATGGVRSRAGRGAAYIATSVIQRLVLTHDRALGEPLARVGCGRRLMVRQRPGR